MLKICSYKFQYIYNVELSTIFTMVYVSSSNVIHFITECVPFHWGGFCPFSGVSSMFNLEEKVWGGASPGLNCDIGAIFSTSPCVSFSV